MSKLKDSLIGITIRCDCIAPFKSYFQNSEKGKLCVSMDTRHLECPACKTNYMERTIHYEDNHEYELVPLELAQDLRYLITGNLVKFPTFKSRDRIEDFINKGRKK